MTDHELDGLARRVGEALAARGLWLATAESCTGGWIAEAVTAIAGSSGWFDRGFVTYSNAAKTDMLGVRDDTLESHGAVSEATVGEMAAGALARSRADLAVAVSGIAGPGGGSAVKPVGTVCIGWARRDASISTTTVQLPGDRAAVRRQTVILALQGVLERCR
ncbi:MAG: nicotinamide-nucleotide amidase [Thauera sp.]